MEWNLPMQKKQQRNRQKKQRPLPNQYARLVHFCDVNLLHWKQKQLFIKCKTLMVA